MKRTARTAGKAAPKTWMRQPGNVVLEILLLLFRISFSKENDVDQIRVILVPLEMQQGTFGGKYSGISQQQQKTADDLYGVRQGLLPILKRNVPISESFSTGLSVVLASPFPASARLNKKRCF